MLDIVAGDMEKAIDFLLLTLLGHIHYEKKCTMTNEIQPFSHV